ncbi:MAG: lipid A-modifier LpxR family protein [Desulfuromonadales bacterium]
MRLKKQSCFGDLLALLVIGAGLEVRCGLNLPRSFGVSLIRPAGSTLFAPGRKPSLYLFGAVDGRYVHRDIFLDGNTFTDSHSIDKKDWVADLAAGVTLSYGNLMLTYSHVTRTREFEGQDDAHNFGSMTLSFFYPLW